MSKPSTEELKTALENLIKSYNQAVEVQTQTKEQIIAVRAVIQDRELEDGDTNTGTSSSSEN
tara:strand:- start:36 stop:221 length:186 start_codon:yes stop_codon:yes gene_type:complete